jgi:hypothetical protein
VVKTTAEKREEQTLKRNENTTKKSHKSQELKFVATLKREELRLK